MPADSFVRGVDGGATTTLALVARPDGSIVGVGRAGCGCIYATASPDTALNEVMAAVEAATGMAGVPRECPTGSFNLP
jgi:N-acetylglucosamine kinase-like BadF-type ATPase